MKIAVLYSYAAQEGIINALKDNGSVVISFFYGSGKPSIMKRILWKLFGYEWYYTKQFNYNLKRMYSANKIKKFDVLLIIKGKKTNSSSRSILAAMNTTYKILWTTDSITRVPEQIAVKNYVDKIFVQDGYDTKNIKGSEWLPLGFDKNIFYNNKIKEIDILLFGNCDLKYYSKRLDYFIEVSKLADNCKIIFVGSNLPVDKKEILELNGVEVYETVPYDKFIDYISSSKICINIHQDDGGEAINPLFFAIPVCGAVQVSDKRSYYEEWLKPNKEYYPIEIEEINSLLSVILKNIVEYQLNNNQMKRIISDNSFHGRAKTILNSVKVN